VWRGGDIRLRSLPSSVPNYFRLPRLFAAALALAGALPLVRAALPPPIVFEARLGQFGAEDYATAVEKLFVRLETAAGRKIGPLAKRKVGLKLYAESGPGLATPVALTRAVIAALERRGFAADGIFLVGLNQRRLRDAGYLPPLGGGPAPFAGHKLFVLESGRFYDPVWFYDSPLPNRFEPVLATLDRPAAGAEPDRDAERKSFLATPLFLDADFWINLPAYTDHPALGVNGALVNATLWNASNTARFFDARGSASAAVAEMAAVPELRETWAFTLVSLERWQFIGGPWFNSLYTRSDPLLWLSADPVLLDALMLDRINAARVAAGFKPVSEEIRLLEFAATPSLGLGTRQTAGARIEQAE
jgi:hypothetical protein